MTTEEKNPGFLAAAIGSWSRLTRAAVLILLIFLGLSVAVWSLARKLQPQTQLDIKIGEAIQLVILRQGQVERRTAVCSVPASQFWLNTGLQLDPGQKVRITASGQVNLAFHRLAQAADEDRFPPADWVGPRGGLTRMPRSDDRLRNQLLLETDDGATYGTLLAYVRPINCKAPGVDNPRPTPISIVREDGCVENPSSVTAELWLVVNDTYLSKDDHDAYIGVPKDESERRVRESRWKYISANSYWTLWWDDNIGHYLVQVDFQGCPKSDHLTGR